MPFAAAQIGLGFRNEISPRAGLLRVREFWCVRSARVRWLAGCCAVYLFVLREFWCVRLALAGWLAAVFLLVLCKFINQCEGR